MVVQTKERGTGVLAVVLDDEVRAAGVLADERHDVVDEARDEDERALGGLLDV
jgi:hypothetical protein